MPFRLGVCLADPLEALRFECAVSESPWLFRVRRESDFSTISMSWSVRRFETPKVRAVSRAVANRLVILIGT